MKRISMAVGVCLLLSLNACSRAPIADGRYIDSSSGSILTFSSLDGAGFVGADTPHAKWGGKYKWLDDDTVQVGMGGAPSTMQFSPDRNEVVLTDHLGNSTKFVRSAAEPPSGGDSSTRADAGLEPPQK